MRPAAAAARRLHSYGGASKKAAPRPDLRAVKAEHIEAARERIFGPQGSLPGDRQLRKPLEGRTLMRWYFPSKFNLQDFRIDEYYEMQAERFAPREDHRFVPSLQRTLTQVMANREKLHDFFQAVSEETFLAHPTLQDLYGLFRLCDSRLALGFQPPEQVFKEHSPMFSGSPLFRSSSHEDAWYLELRRSVMDKLSLEQALEFDRQLQSASSKAEIEAMLSEEVRKHKLAPPPVPIGQTTIGYWTGAGGAGAGAGAARALEAHPTERDLSKRLREYAVEDLAALCKTFRTRNARKLEEFIQRQVTAWKSRRPDLYTADEFPAAFQETLGLKSIVAVDKFLTQQVTMWRNRVESTVSSVQSPDAVQEFLREFLKIRSVLPQTAERMGFFPTLAFDDRVFTQALGPNALQAALRCFEEMASGAHPEPLLSGQAELWWRKGFEQHTVEEVREAEEVRDILLQWAKKHDAKPYFLLALDTDDVCWASNLQREQDSLQQKVKDCESRGSLAQTRKEVLEVLKLRVSLSQEVAQLKLKLEAELERKRGEQTKEAADLEGRKLGEEMKEAAEAESKPEHDEQARELALELKSKLDELTAEVAELERELGALEGVIFDRGVFKQPLSPETLEAVWHFIIKHTREAPEDAPGAFSIAAIWLRQVVLWCHRGMQPHTAQDVEVAAQVWRSLAEVPLKVVPKHAKLAGEFADENDTKRWDDAVHEAEQAREDAMHLPLLGAPMVQRREVSIDLPKERHQAERDWEELHKKGPKHLQAYVERRHRFVDPMFRRRRLKWLEREAAGQNKKRETEYNKYYAKHPDDHTEWPTNKASVTVVWPSPYH